jgi:hypothetical protein
LESSRRKAIKQTEFSLDEQTALRAIDYFFRAKKSEKSLFNLNL